MKTFKEFKDELPVDEPIYNEDIYNKWKNSINMNEKDEHADPVFVEMLKSGPTFDKAKKSWTIDKWQIAKSSPGKINRLKKMRTRMNGNPFEKSGEKTNWHKSLLKLGHDPLKTT